MQLGACAQSVPAASLGDDPTVAFAALERRLADAPQVSFSVSLNETTAEEDRTTQLDAQLRIASNDRIRIESTGEVSGLGAAPGVVSDGQEMTGGRGGIEGPSPDFRNEAVPSGLAADLKGSILRWGAYRTLMQLVSGVPPGSMIEDDIESEAGDSQAHATIQNASWGLPETYNGTLVRPLSFSLPHPFASEADVVLWLSVDTSLPVRQTVRIKTDTSERITDEVYSDWSFEAIPDSTFLLPEQP